MPVCREDIIRLHAFLSSEPIINANLVELKAFIDKIISTTEEAELSESELWEFAYLLNALTEIEFAKLEDNLPDFTDDGALARKFACLTKLKSQKILLKREQINILKDQKDDSRILTIINEAFKHSAFESIKDSLVHKDLAKVIIGIWHTKLLTEEYSQSPAILFETCFKSAEIEFNGRAIISTNWLAFILRHTDPLGMLDLVTAFLPEPSFICSYWMGIIYKLAQQTGYTYQEMMQLAKILWGGDKQDNCTTGAGVKDVPIKYLLDHVDAKEEVDDGYSKGCLDLLLSKQENLDFLLEKKGSELQYTAYLFNAMHLMSGYETTLASTLQSSNFICPQGVLDIVLSYFFSLETLRLHLTTHLNSPIYPVIPKKFTPANHLNLPIGLAPCKKVTPARCVYGTVAALLFIYRAFNQGIFSYRNWPAWKPEMAGKLEEVTNWFIETVAELEHEAKYEDDDETEVSPERLRETLNYIEATQAAVNETFDAQSLLVSMRKKMVDMSPIPFIHFSVDSEAKKIKLVNDSSSLILVNNFLKLAYLLPQQNKHLQEKSLDINFLCYTRPKTNRSVHWFGLHFIIEIHEGKRQYTPIIVDNRRGLVPLGYVRLLVKRIKKILTAPTSSNKFFRNVFLSAASDMKKITESLSVTIKEEDNFARIQSTFRKCIDIIEFLECCNKLSPKTKNHLLTGKTKKAIPRVIANMCTAVKHFQGFCELASLQSATPFSQSLTYYFNKSGEILEKLTKLASGDVADTKSSTGPLLCQEPTSLQALYAENKIGVVKITPQLNADSIRMQAFIKKMLDPAVDINYFHHEKTGHLYANWREAGEIMDSWFDISKTFKEVDLQYITLSATQLSELNKFTQPSCLFKQGSSGAKLYDQDYCKTIKEFLAAQGKASLSCWLGLNEETFQVKAKELLLNSLIVIKLIKDHYLQPSQKLSLGKILEQEIKPYYNQNINALFASAGQNLGQEMKKQITASRQSTYPSL